MVSGLCLRIQEASMRRPAACPPHTRRAAWHAAHGRRSCSATLATHAARRSSSLLLTPGSRRSLVDQPRRAAPPGSASSEPREPKAPQAAERVEEGAPGSRQLRRNRCSRVVAPGCSLQAATLADRGGYRVSAPLSGAPFTSASGSRARDEPPGHGGPWGSKTPCTRCVRDKHKGG